MTRDLNIFRWDKADAATKNPYRDRSTMRAPGNVPYVVDNLWEWRRPPGYPDRRHSLFASPLLPRRSRESGQAQWIGRLFLVQTVEQCVLAQISQWDAREHPDCKNLRKLLLDLLGQPWVGQWIAGQAGRGSLVDSLSHQRRKWIPLFAGWDLSPRFGDRVWNAVSFWDNVRLVGPRASRCARDGGKFSLSASSGTCWRTRPDESTEKANKFRLKAEGTRMYLWLNCEGWVRFGPFEWLRFDDDPRVIRDQDGTVVASFDGSDWRTVHEYRRLPMVQSDGDDVGVRLHPHPMHPDETADTR